MIRAIGAVLVLGSLAFFGLCFVVALGLAGKTDLDDEDGQPIPYLLAEQVAARRNHR